MWFVVVYTLILFVLLWTHSPAPRESATFWPLWWRVSLSIRVQTMLNHIKFWFVKSNVSTAPTTWRCIFITALPISVAPKNVQKGTRQWPQVIPAKSNRGFGTCGRMEEIIITLTSWSVWEHSEQETTLIETTQS